MSLQLHPGDRVEFTPNIFTPHEKRFTGEVSDIQGDCVWVRVVLRSGREQYKAVHRQWLKPLPFTGETTCRRS